MESSLQPNQESFGCGTGGGWAPNILLLNTLRMNIHIYKSYQKQKSPIEMTLFYTDTAKISALIQNTPFSVALSFAFIYCSRSVI